MCLKELGVLFVIYDLAFIVLCIFAIILLRIRGLLSLIAILLLCECLCIVSLPAVPWVCLWSVACGLWL